MLNIVQQIILLSSNFGLPAVKNEKGLIENHNSYYFKFDFGNMLKFILQSCPK